LDDNAGNTEDVECEILIPTVDSVEIKDDLGPSGTTPLDHSINLGESETYYAIGFNVTAGNIGSVDVDWELSNFEVGVLSTAYGPQTTFTAFLDKTGVTTISARYNSQNVGSFTLTILDNIPPEADAGSDQTAEEGESVLFDGTDSSDNVEIATYTWTFTHKGTPTTLTGETVSFDFKESGTYVISLEVMDFSGNTDTDTFSVIVEKKAMEPEDNLFLWLLLLIIIIVVVLILTMILIGKKKKKQRCRICGTEFLPQTEAEAEQGMCPNCAEQGVFGQAMGSAAGSQPTQPTTATAPSKMTIKCPTCQKEFEQEIKGSGPVMVTCPYCNTQGRMEI
jgi:DNA-directed RNA polymerase subunit RPC12/RpoP